MLSHRSEAMVLLKKRIEEGLIFFASGSSLHGTPFDRRKSPSGDCILQTATTLQPAFLSSAIRVEAYISSPPQESDVQIWSEVSGATQRESLCRTVTRQ